MRFLKIYTMIRSIVISRSWGGISWGGIGRGGIRWGRRIVRRSWRSIRGSGGMVGWFWGRGVVVVVVMGVDYFVLFVNGSIVGRSLVGWGAVGRSGVSFDKGQNANL